MKHTPTNLHELDLQSDEQHCNTTTIRHLPHVDNYNPYYPDPDFGFDPYWDIQIYNQHHLHFYHNFTKNTTDIVTDLPDIDQNLNAHLTKAIVDPRQSTPSVPHQATSEQSKAELPQNGPVVTLTATVKEHFVKTLISRDGEPDYVPPTTNLRNK